MRPCRPVGPGLRTRVEDVCEAAGLTKGSFFHHFDSKEDLALAAADYWSEVTSALFAAAPYHQPADPLDRLLAYVDFRKALLQGELPDFTCLVGTMTQEVYDTHPIIRAACEKSIREHAATLVPDIEAAIKKYGVKADWTPESLALHTQGVIQGAFILAKARHTAIAARRSIDHLRRLEIVFGALQLNPGEDVAESHHDEVGEFPVYHYVQPRKTATSSRPAFQAWRCTFVWFCRRRTGSPWL